MNKQEHLKAYIGTGLKFKYGDKVWTMAGLGSDEQGDKICLEDEEGNHYWSELGLTLWMPILKPLRQLTIRLEGSEELPISLEDVPTIVKFPLSYPASVVNWLIDENYDVYGLIKNGSALDETNISMKVTGRPIDMHVVSKNTSD